MNKEGSFLPMFAVLTITLLVATLWDKVSAIKGFIQGILDPSVGVLLNWNLTVGMLIVVFIITLIVTLVQKFTTDQEALKEIKEEQKALQKEMQNVKDNPTKMMEWNKKNMELTKKSFSLTSKSMIYTSIPFVLFFRWFTEFFANLGNPKLLGFLGWFWFYMIFSVIFSIFLKKIFKAE